MILHPSIQEQVVKLQYVTYYTGALTAALKFVQEEHIEGTIYSTKTQVYEYLSCATLHQLFNLKSAQRAGLKRHLQ